jgi:hypothetical protein
MQMTHNTINAGNILVIDCGIYSHVGVADGFGFVYENSRDKGGRGKVSLEEFSGGKKNSKCWKVG